MFVNVTMCPSPTTFKKTRQASLAHACNPSYTGGRDQDSSLKPAWVNSLGDPISKNTLHKRLVEWLKVNTLSSNPSNEKRGKNKENEI
jgi:hypothetical protein